MRKCFISKDLKIILEFMQFQAEIELKSDTLFLESGKHRKIFNKERMIDCEQ